jgi:hypothetical protein
MPKKTALLRPILVIEGFAVLVFAVMLYHVWQP